MSTVGADSMDLAGAMELLVTKYLYLTDPDTFLFFLNSRMRKQPAICGHYAKIYGSLLELNRDGTVGFNAAALQKKADMERLQQQIIQGTHQ